MHIRIDTFWRRVRALGISLCVFWCSLAVGSERPKTIVETTVTILMEQRPFKSDTESKEERQARMEIFARAIDYAARRAACIGFTPDCKPIFSDRRMMTALLIEKAYAESSLAQYVHEGRCLDGPDGQQCDKDRDGVPRAHSPWQIWKVASASQAEWESFEGADLEATKRAAWKATKMLAGAAPFCKEAYPNDEISSAIAGFAGSCHRMRPAKVQGQAAFARRILNRLPAQ